MRLLLLLAGLGLALVVLAAGLVVLIQSRAAPAASGFQLAYSSLEGDIYLSDARGERQLRVTEDGARAGLRHRFPTWSPDGKLAFIRQADRPAGPGAGASPAAVMVAEPEGRLRPVFESAEHPPFYLYWSPTGEEVTFLTQEERGIALRVAAADGSYVRVLDRGAPYYWDWSPDGRRLLTHVGGTVQTAPDARLALLSPDETPGSQILPLSPGYFLAPEWSPDGTRVLVAVLEEEGPALYLSDPEGRSVERLLSFRGRIAFDWAPVGSRVAYLESRVPASYFLGPVRVLPRPGAEPVPLGDRQAVAFFWSPDGQRLAVLVPERQEERPGAGDGRRAASRAAGAETFAAPVLQDQLRLAWYVAQADSGEWFRLTEFSPSQDFLFTLPFFDQYARSMTLWSPDGAWLAYAGSTGSDSKPGIWVVEASPGAAPRRVADGTMLSWRWP